MATHAAGGLAALVDADVATVDGGATDARPAAGAVRVSQHRHGHLLQSVGRGAATCRQTQAPGEAGEEDTAPACLAKLGQVELGTVLMQMQVNTEALEQKEWRDVLRPQ